MRWDPRQYDRYASERSRPFFDLVARVDVEAPRRVVDLGCGTGSTTAWLTGRWPDAVVEGLDSSTEMIEQARTLETTAHFRVESVEDWTPPADADVVVSNAVLQWVPTHLELLERWAKALPAGGRLAFQVPGNFGSPSHTLMRELAESSRWADRLRGVLRHQDSVRTPTEYATLLLDAGLEVDAWETTYLHLLPGPDPVLDWLRGTGLRPVLAALSEAEGAEFTDTLAGRYRTAFPSTPHGTFLPFRRIFAVGSKP